MVICLNYCSQNGGNVYRDPYYNGNPNIGPRIKGNLDQYPYTQKYYPNWIIQESRTFELLFWRSMKAVHIDVKTQETRTFVLLLRQLEKKIIYTRILCETYEKL